MITLTTAGSTTGTKFITPSITLLWEIVSKTLVSIVFKCVS